MRRTLWIPAVLVAAVAGGFLATGCGEKAGPGPGPGGPAPAAPPSDTGETARRAAAAFFRPGKDRIPHELATNPGEPWGDYVGSKACAPCHREDYENWRDSYHSRTLYDVHERTVIGDFSGATAFKDPVFKWEVQPRRVDGTFVMDITESPTGTVTDTYGSGTPERATGRFTVLYAFGNRRHQPYIARDEAGRHWVLPVYWNDVVHSWQWDGWRPYVSTCAHCHVSGIETVSAKLPGSLPAVLTEPQRWTPPPDKERWAEGAVGCEVCHGPGKAHIEAVQSMGDAAYRAHLAAGGAPTIYDPGKDTPERRMQLCDMCHNFHSESQVTFVPSPTGFTRQPIRRPSQPTGNPRTDAGRFHPDGTHMSPCTVGRVFRESKMGRKGVECRDCHDSHGNADWAELVLPTSDNRLCLKCHEADPSGFYKDAESVLRHTRHAAGSPGSLCVECHMPRDKRFSNGIHVMSAQIHSHAMTVPTGYESERGGPEPSCNTCHTDRDAAWTRAVLSAWKAGTPPPK